MKRNIGFKVTIAVLVFALLAACALGAVTYARYITTGSGSVNTASVAKWGVRITGKANGTGFAKTSNGGLIVSSTHNMLAPGMTEASMADIGISGTPEVAATVNFTGTVTLTGNWQASGAYYCPLLVTVGDDEIWGMDYNSTSTFITAIQNAIAGHTFTTQANESIATATAPSITVEWETKTDAQDTALGDDAAANPNSRPSISVVVNADIQQKIS